MLIFLCGLVAGVMIRSHAGQYASEMVSKYTSIRHVVGNAHQAHRLLVAKAIELDDRS